MFRSKEIPLKPATKCLPNKSGSSPCRKNNSPEKLGKINVDSVEKFLKSIRKNFQI